MPVLRYMNLIEFITIIILGAVSGFCEFIPVSPGGHLIFAREILTPNFTDEFFGVFSTVIRLGSVLALILLYKKKLSLFKNDPSSYYVNADGVALWVKILIACFPAGFVALVLGEGINDFFYESDSVLMNVGALFLFYGLLYIVLELRGRYSERGNGEAVSIPLRTVFLAGLFQTAALVPGSSRLGIVMLAAMIFGAGRKAACEFAAYTAIPMLFFAAGYRIVKYIKYYGAFTGDEIVAMIAGGIAAFLVSFYVIKTFIAMLTKNSLKFFGAYRIVVAMIIFAYCAYTKVN